MKIELDECGMTWLERPCPRCKGHGEIDNWHSHECCRSCAGTGEEYGTPDEAFWEKQKQKEAAALAALDASGE